MNQTVLQQTPTHNATVSLAALSKPHGYRFDGDEVHLQARFTVLDPGANQRTWALQLWACPSAPASARDLTGQIVAEVALPPMSEVADETEHVDMSAFAWPPTGSAEHFMALVLAAGRPGQFDEVHDVAVYPRPQRFLQPRMRGTVGYRSSTSRILETPRTVVAPSPLNFGHWPPRMPEAPSKACSWRGWSLAHRSVKPSRHRPPLNCRIRRRRLENGTSC